MNMPPPGGGGWGPPGQPPPGGYGAPPQYGPPQQQYAPPGYPPPQQQGMYYGQPMAGYGGKTCPRCQSPYVRKVSWTWWGGWLGPMMFNHHVCNQCSFGFNGNSGKSNGTAIGIYFAVGLFLALAFVGCSVVANLH